MVELEANFKAEVHIIALVSTQEKGIYREYMRGYLKARMDLLLKSDGGVESAPTCMSNTDKLKKTGP
ncbi:hypothetical protein SRHO_G00128020 [Serrasalmus rhombeus]